MNRRQLLATVGVGIGGTSGCLRLTDASDEPTSTDGTATATDSQPTGTRTDGGSGSGTAGEVTLTENWAGEPGVDFVWTDGGSIYFNDFNGAGSASHGSGVE